MFLRLAKRERAPEIAGSLESYLYRAAINGALDLIRSRTAARSVPIDDALGLSAKAEDRGGDELAAQLRQALKEMNPKHAEMFVLRYFEEYDNADIAKLLDTTSAVVAVTLHRIRQQLQKKLEPARRTN